jgi:uncharacterized protein (TIGR02117 family)
MTHILDRRCAIFVCCSVLLSGVELISHEKSSEGAWESIPSGKTIYVVSHGWHTGIVLNGDEIPELLLPEKNEYPNSTYIEFGWGDADFYMDPDAGILKALNAALSSDSSVLHVVWFSDAVEKYFPADEVVELTIGDKEFERLCVFLHNTFARESTGKSYAIRHGYYPQSRFYRSLQQYHLLNTCNVWTANALQSAGFSLTPVFFTTAESIMDEVKGHGKVVSPQ